MKRIPSALALILGIGGTLICALSAMADDSQMGKSVQLGNGPVTMGSPVQLNNSPVKSGNRRAKLGNRPVQLTNGPVKLTNGPVSLTNGPVPLTNGPVPLTNGPVQLTNGPVKLTNGTVKLTNGTVQLGNGITLRNEGACNHHLMIGTDTLFDFDKSDLTAAAENTLTHLGAEIKKYGNHPATVEGHTDGKGTDQYNQGLSERRANSVKTWLVAHNFVTGQTPAIGYGKKRPVAPNEHPDGSDNPAGRQLNRRVEVVIDTCH